VNVSIATDDLRDFIKAVVSETLGELERAGPPNGRIAFSEPEAAALIGLLPHQLRDERLRGRIEASQVVGRRVRYLRADLLEYLARGRQADSPRPRRRRAD